MMNYFNFDLDAFEHKQTADGDQFRVRVADSPVGKQAIGEAEKRKMPLEVRQKIGALKRRALSLAEMIDLGEKLGEALFPPRVRSLLDSSLHRLGSEERLRIRLMLDTYALAELPWEYIYLPEAGVPGARRGLEGFLALDRRVSLVRYESMVGPPVPLDAGVSPIRLVALLASPDDPTKVYEKLDVAKERQSIEQAVADLPAIHADFYPDAKVGNPDPTVDTLLGALVKPAHIFHFAGHGEFKGEMGEHYGSQEGAGAVILLDENRHPKLFLAQNLARNLTGCSVRLAVLTACEVAQVDAANAWAGVVTALIHADIPAVVGMQFRIRDANALAFSRAFYRALSAGQPIDAAVADGRLAILNCGDENERDWGVPVLYLRAEDGVLFPARKPVDASLQSVAPQPPPGLADLLRQIKDNVELAKADFERQVGLRNSLYMRMRRRLPNLPVLNLQFEGESGSWEEGKWEEQWQDFFAQYHGKLTKSEKLSFDEIRIITETTLQEQNRKTKQILDENPELIHALPPLKDLQFHLDEWLKKYDGLFVKRPEMCVLYVGVLGGKPFPSGIDQEIQSWLDSHGAPAATSTSR